MRLPGVRAHSLRAAVVKLASAGAFAALVAAVFFPASRVLAVGFPPWSTPETLALTGAGVTVKSATLTMTAGRAAAIWTENDAVARAAFRPSGGPFGAPQTLDTQSVVFDASIALSSTGKATAAWVGHNNTGPVRTVMSADLAAGTSTFGAASAIFTSSTAQDPGNTNTGIDASGGTLITFRGDGSSGYSHVWSAERAVAANAYTLTSRTGNFEVFGLKTAVASDSTAFAYSWGIAAGVNHMIIGPRRGSTGTWFPEAFAAPYSGATIQQGPQSLVVDGSDNAFMTIDVCCNGGSPGPNFLMVNSSGNPPQGALNPDAAAFSSPAGASFPVVVVDAAGNAVMAWIRPTNDVYAAYRAAGTSTTFGPLQLIASSVTPASGHMALTMDSGGNAIIAWKDACVGLICTLKTRIRQAGSSSTFNAAVTVASNVKDDSTLSLAADGANHVGVMWRDSTTPINLKASFINTTLPDHLTITSSSANLTSGSGRTITAELRDVNGAVVPSDSSTSVTFSQTSGTGSVTGLGSSTAASGIASRTVTGGVAGSVTITASASGLVSGTSTFTVLTGPATQLIFTSSTADLATGVNRILTASIRDAAGNAVTTDNSTQVTFGQAAGPGSVTGLGASTAASGVASMTVMGAAVGSVTVAAQATGLTAGTTAFNVTSTPTFSDTPATAGSTTIKAAHLAELRDAIAALRARYGLSVFAWTDPTLTAGSSQIKAVHITELRFALNEVYVAAGRAVPTYTNPSIVAGTTLVSATHINELRAAVLAIW